MNKETFTTFEISQFCNVFITTVANWIDEGKLPAYRTPGGHRRVNRRDLLEFLSKYGMPVPEALLETAEKKILVVDDNAEMVELLRQALLKQNPRHIVRTAGDGFEAGKQVAVFQPHVVILDIVLPGLDGLQVCQNIRKDPATRGMHVIVITGHDEKDTRAAFDRLGVDAYMQKPVNIQKLLARVQELLDPNGAAARPAAGPKRAP